MFVSLARKYRPKKFAEVAVQSHVSNTLRSAVARGRVAPAYLLCGPRGVGKTTLARVLAMALNCERRQPGDDGEPCGECASCTRIWSGSASLDVVEIDAASNRGVDDARELRERAMYAPSSEQRYKVYIVDEAHMLTREAWNALLKILEEPPPRVVFVFATTEPQKIAQLASPVLSRVQRFDFRRMSASDVRDRLASVLAAEHVEAEPEALAMLARAADGSMRDALSLTDQALSLGDGHLTAARVRDALGLVPEDEYLRMFELVAGRRAADIFPAVTRLADAGVDLGLFLAGFTELVRAVLAHALGGELPDQSDRVRAAVREYAARYSPADLVRMLSTITDAEPRFRRSAHQQILLETLLVRFALLDHTVSLEDVLRGLRGGGPGGGRGESGGAREDPPAVARDREPADVAPRRTERRTAPADMPRDPRPAGIVAVPADARPRSVPPATLEPLALVPLVDRWHDVVDRVRADSRIALAAALEHCRPIAVSPAGDIVVELDPTGDIYRQPIASSADDVLSAVGTLFTGATRLQVRVADAPVDDLPARRFTEEGVRRERLASLRRRDPSLDVAVDALDLELLE